jgi:hypothetical protein
MKRLESSFLPANFPRSQRAIMLPSKPCDPPTHPQRQVIPRIYLDIDAVIGYVSRLRMEPSVVSLKFVALVSGPKAVLYQPGAQPQVRMQHKIQG